MEKISEYIVSQEAATVPCLIFTKQEALKVYEYFPKKLTCSFSFQASVS